MHTRFPVKGDFKSLYTSGLYSSGIENNLTISGVPINSSYIANNADILVATEVSALVLQPGVANLQATNGGATGTVAGFANANGGTFSLLASNPTSEISTAISGNSTTSISNLTLSHQKNSAEATNVTVEKLKGVTFDFKTAGSNVEGSYTFPRNNGAVNQVLTTNGSIVNAQLIWKDASALTPATVVTNTFTPTASTNNLITTVNGVPSTAVDLTPLKVEPWQVQGATTKATVNTENIYQMGKVAIGTTTIPDVTVSSTDLTVISSPKLHVAGDISTTGKIYTTNSVYADYVFDYYFEGFSKIYDQYKFKSLTEVAAFIKANKHLPGVTPIKDLMKNENGYTLDLAQLSVQQLEKLEELYLHVIEMNTKMNQKDQEIKLLQEKTKSLEERLSRLEQFIDKK